MTLLEKLQAHKGSLLRLRSDLYWYDGRGFDGSPGRLCLLLDADAGASVGARVAAVVPAVPYPTTAVLLLVDGSPRWVLVNEEGMELLDGGDQ